MTRDQKRLALAYLRDIVISDLDDLYGDSGCVMVIQEEDRDLLKAMRAAHAALRKVKATK